MIIRKEYNSRIKQALNRSRVVALIGPRQSGKTTLARQFVPESSLNYFDLEDPLSYARLTEPMTALEPLKGLIVIDEVQRYPEIFPILRVLCDRSDNLATFLILGSAGGDLMRQSSESLAGRIEYINISGFSIKEISSSETTKLWQRGGFPLSFLAANEENSLAWRKSFVMTLLERDFPQWGVRTPATALLRFWMMLAHYHGQIWNCAEVSRSLDQTHNTTKRYLDLLSDAFMVRQLQPWFANIKKRQVKAPKIYFRDSGILHHLLGITTEKRLLTHPKCGASWEGFVIEQILRTSPHDAAYYWATHQGAEIDLILRNGDRLSGFEIKRTDTPRVTPSVKAALEDLSLDSVSIVYPGPKSFTLSPRINVVSLQELQAEPIF
jgi:predicted AAA+ superfamily ATPase